MPTMMTANGVLPLIATTLSPQHATANARFKLIELEAIAQGLRDWLWEEDQSRRYEDPPQYDELILALRQIDQLITQTRNLFIKLEKELPE